MVVAVEPAQASIQAEQPGNDAAVKSEEKAADSVPRKPRQKRPNYHEIHAKPLPLDVYPLPAFIPHNPISIVRIAVALLSSSIWSPKSHTVVHRAYYSPETQSIHVTDPASVRALWEQGFWGKGSLSRSEPQWLVAEKRKRGAEASKTSAEVTQSRREERRQFKLERAKAQREAIEQQLRDEGKLDADGTLDDLVEDGQVSESPRGTLYTAEAGDVVTLDGNSIVTAVDASLANRAPSWGEHAVTAVEEEDIEDMEHLQLTPEEAFFLSYVLGALDIVQVTNSETSSSQPYPPWLLLRLYCAYASVPHEAKDLEGLATNLRIAYNTQKTAASIDPSLTCIPEIAPDNPFILKYVVYHHFRSLGWVVRPGIKFAVDYLLYIRGPAFTHAEFAIMIIPSYSDPYWKNAVDGTTNMKDKDWWWLHRVNRVQTQVMKTLILVYVEVPAPWDQNHTGDNFKADIGGVLQKYSVREFVLKRWRPSRNRD
ncbi:tRNA-splicing endonuclease-like protein subunit Sen2 [Plenodomus tracheiphilus IPT5]|uniref:tRNA-splicing endonuclease subunit Sen2 n=1 Tax=Plenodomus tracheiphilus IPT5 TaxID=1408161 RepID=A0A6A7BC50_9PLEO|nr:tRNA-splicing endonuclease-like protein subunit Sen2 [Plenodomus tracheiphilus IPT5]